MAFKLNENQQLTINDSFNKQTARTKKIVRDSWAGDFADMVFPAINEERFSVLYSDKKASRPNTPINVIVGALMLKENNGMSDEELVQSLCCDVRFQYALHTTSYVEQPVSDRTFSRFRERVAAYKTMTGRDLLDEAFAELNEVYMKYMNLHSNIKRMDSLMIASRCKRMSRLEIIYQTTANAVRLIHRLGHDELLTTDLLHYMDAEDYNEVIYYCKGEDVVPRLEKALREAAAVLKIMEDDEWHGFSEYQLLVRVLAEQSEEAEDGNPVPKADSDISSKSLQNPSDPDATFRSKAGKSHKGYVGNVTETMGENGDSLITDFSLAPNTHSDSEFCREYLEKRPEDAEAETLITDGAYGSLENQELAESKNVTLVTTALTGKLPEKFLAGFRFTEDGSKVTSCPMGHEPEKCTYYPKTGVCRAQFSKTCCANCPHREECQAKEQKKTYAVYISKTKAARAAYLKKLSSEEYLGLTRKRNAVEGVMSVLRRKYRIDQLPVYGLERSMQFIQFKIAAYDFNKFLRHMRRTRVESAQDAAIA